MTINPRLVKVRTWVALGGTIYKVEAVKGTQALLSDGKGWVDFSLLQLPTPAQVEAVIIARKQ